MVQGSAQEWFLEVEGKKTGPFTTEQILGLLSEKEIPGTQRVTSDGAHWMTVRELADRQNPRPASKPFVPPPRPQELTPPPPALPGETVQEKAPAKPARDPAIGLMDALQAAKDRKSHASTLRQLPQV